MRVRKCINSVVMAVISPSLPRWEAFLSGKWNSPPEISYPGRRKAAYKIIRKGPAAGMWAP